MPRRGYDSVKRGILGQEIVGPLQGNFLSVSVNLKTLASSLAYLEEPD